MDGPKIGNAQLVKKLIRELRQRNHERKRRGGKKKPCQKCVPIARAMEGGGGQKGRESTVLNKIRGRANGGRDEELACRTMKKITGTVEANG